MTRFIGNAQRPAAQRGLTVVELMVAVTISLVLLAGLIQILASSRQAYRVQEAASRLQENGRFAVDFLARDLRMADFWGCVPDLSEVTNNLPPPPATGYINFGAGGIGGTNGASGAPDSVTIREAYAGSIRVTGVSGPASIPVASTANLQHNEVVIVSDCSHADVFRITNTDPVTTPLIPNTNLSKNYNTDAQVYQARELTYSVGANADGDPVLQRNDGGGNVDLVEGVEDMQIVYGEDTDGDGAPNRYVPIGTAGLDLTRVVSLRVTLTVRSLEDNIVPAINSGDRRLRRTFTTTVSLRNRLG